MFILQVHLCQPGSRRERTRDMTQAELDTIRNRVATFFSNRSISISLRYAEIRNGDLWAEIETPEDDSWFQDLAEAAANQNNYRGTLRVYDGDTLDIIATCGIADNGIKGRMYPKPTKPTNWNVGRS